MAIDVILKWMSEGAKEVVDDAQKIDDKVVDVGKDAEEAGEGFVDMGKDVDETTDKVDELGKETKNTKKETDKLGDSLRAARKAGVALAAAGAGLSVMAHHMTEARLEADKLQGMLNAKLSSAGMTHASDEVNELASALAMLNGEDPGRLADKIANVVSTGRGFRSLAKSGIVISSDERSAIRAADPAEQWELIQKAAQRSMSELESSLTDLQKATYAQQVRWDELQEQMGEGASVVRVALYNGLVSPLMTVLESNEGLAKTAGAIVSIGGAALSGIGSVITLGAQLGLIAQGFPTLAAKSSAAFTTITTGAGTATAAVLTTAAALGLITISIAALTIAWKGSADAARLDNEELEKKWGILGKIWNMLSNIGDTKIGRYFFAVLDGRGVQEAKNILAEETGKVEAFDRKRDISHASRDDIMKSPVIDEAHITNINTGSQGARGNNNFTVSPSTQATQNANGDYVIKIQPQEFVIPNNLNDAVGAL